MCWCSTNKPVKQIAKEDIPVFKIVRYLNSNGISSFYYEFNYKLNKVYFDNFGDIKEDYIAGNLEYYIDYGFHSYSKDCTITMRDTSYLTICTIRSSEKLLLDRLFSPYLLHRAQCIIPKDSFYYLNEQGEYVSDQIKIIKLDL